MFVLNSFCSFLKHEKTMTFETLNGPSTTLVSPISSIGIRDGNIIYLIILYEDMNLIYVLLYPICVHSRLMCACKYFNMKLSLYY